MEKSLTERFHTLLRDFDTAVLVTHGQHTHLRSRPMVLARVEENCDLWFVTSAESAKVHEIEVDTRVLAVCQNGRSSCLSISGHAFLVRDRAKTRELWKPAHRVWFPKGVDDPNIVLIQVIGEQGEYWDNTGIKGITYVYQAIKAVVTGTTPNVSDAQHGVVHLG